MLLPAYGIIFLLLYSASRRRADCAGDRRNTGGNPDMESEKNSRQLARYLSPLGAWAFAFGCSVGWGAFVMPADTFLPVAGPLGTLIGFAAGGLLMFVLARNYQYMIGQYPDSGGAYTYASRAFGSDHGFLAGWFLTLAYIVVFWGNATALPMIARYLAGDLLQAGFHYVLFGYDVYLSEILLAVGMMVLAALICLRPRAASLLQIVFALALAAGLAVCFLAVLFTDRISPSSLAPAFAPEVEPLSGIFSIVSLAPWAFVGFETVSHSAAEYRFRPGRTFFIMAAALITAALAYGVTALLSVAHLPAGCTDWTVMLRQLPDKTGIEALPAFSSVQAVLGRGGMLLLGLAAFSAIATGLIGFITAASRLLYSISLDGMLPGCFSRVNSRGVPDFAVISILAVSVPVPFLGRTAINWLVDVTTICVIIAYGYVSASALHIARQNRHVSAAVSGTAGLLISCVFSVVFLVPNVLLIRTMSAESYLLIAVWAILGLLWFRYLYVRNIDRRSAPNTMVWIVFLVLILYTSMLWVMQTASSVEQDTAANIEQCYMAASGDSSSGPSEERMAFVRDEMKEANRILRNSSFAQIGFIIAAMMIVFNIYNIMHKRAQQTELEKIQAEESSRLKSVFLSNMSHDIRTPMNAIVGMTAIARDHIDDRERVLDCLKKIGVSSRHLLGLINDVLDIAKIESGKLVLSREPLALPELMENLCFIIRPLSAEKEQHFDIFLGEILCEQLYGDTVRLSQVLLNLLSNAVKFTPEGGSVSLHLSQNVSSRGERFVQTHFEVRDSGIGISRAFQEKLFTSFEREDSLRVQKTQGSGLGLAISKHIVDAMEGSITCQSEQGAGSVFHVAVDLECADSPEPPALPALKVLVADSSRALCARTALMLEQLGAEPVSCFTGGEALRLVRQAREQGTDFDAAILDSRLETPDAASVVRQLREASGGHSPACFLAGYDRIEGTDGDAVFLARPLFRSVLRQALSGLGREQEQAGEACPPAQEPEELDLTGKRILLAEDNEINAEIATMVLEQFGAQVDWAEDGRLAVERFESAEPGCYSAVLMDLRMPNMNGLEAAQAIRRMPRTDARTIPILALTADALAEDAQRCLDAGMNEHLTKPIDIGQLSDALRRYL